MTGRTSSCGKVLVVDDDERFRAFVTATLGTAGFESIEAAPGPEALACADSESLDAPDLGYDALMRPAFEFWARMYADGDDDYAFTIEELAAEVPKV